MSVSKKIIKFLEEAKIKYELIEHRTVYTAYDKASTLKVPQKTVGKTLLIKCDNQAVIVLIPANKNLAQLKFKKAINNWRKKQKEKSVKKIGFISEQWMKKNLKGIKVGAVPPFGNLWKMPTFAARELFNNPKIIVNSGEYNLSIKISPSSFKKLVSDLIIGNFSESKKIKKAKRRTRKTKKK